MQFWLVKQEPTEYSWQQFCQDGHTVWNGVRNYQARNYLKAMNLGDCVLFYHSNVGKEIVGIAQVTKTAYPDPTAVDSSWVAVDIKPIQTLNKTVTLEQLKQIPDLSQLGLLKQARLSVMPIQPAEFQLILEISDTKLTFN